MCKALEDMRDRYLKMGEDRGITIGEARGEARGITIGEARGITIGEARGRTETSASVVRRMLYSGKYPLEEISLMTDLPLEEVRRLQAELTA